MTADRRARLREQPCPNAVAHADWPDGYAARHEWMARMARTHVQSRCSGCGRWEIWTAREGVRGGDVV